MERYTSIDAFRANLVDRNEEDKRNRQRLRDLTSRYQGRTGFAGPGAHQARLDVEAEVRKEGGVQYLFGRIRALSEVIAERERIVLNVLWDIEGPEFIDPSDHS